MKKILKRMSIGIVSLLLIGVVAFAIYVSDYSKATDAAIAKLGSTEKVRVIVTQDTVEFLPKNSSNVGLVFYPGGKVEHESYARMMYALAEQGVTAVIVRMPFNLAMFNMNGADDVIKKYEDLETWYLAGHSLGGVFASEFLWNSAGVYEGMIFLASYPNSDFSNVDISMLSINGSNDTVMNSESFEAARSKFSQDTTFVVIEGGNHAQFGDYGEQKGDTGAAITSDLQQEMVVTSIMKFME